jgi:hypothetical protein
MNQAIKVVELPNSRQMSIEIMHGGTVEIPGVSDALRQELAAILQTATQPVVISVGDRKCKVTLMPPEGSSDSIQTKSKNVISANESEPTKTLPDFLYYGGSLYGRLAMNIIAPDFVSTAMTVEPAKKNLSDECLRACQRRNLPQRVTIKNEVKYAIATEIGIQDLGEFADFKWGQDAYRMINKLMSEHGYSRKPKTVPK